LANRFPFSGSSACQSEFVISLVFFPFLQIFSPEPLPNATISVGSFPLLWELGAFHPSHFSQYYFSTFFQFTWLSSFFTFDFIHNSVLCAALILFFFVGIPPDYP